MSIGGAVVGEVKIRVSFDSGKAKKETKTLDNSLKNVTKSVHSFGKGFERFGRTLSISGFVMGIVARRLITSFTNIATSILKIVEESAGLDKTLSFLGDTLSALGLAGMLTDDKMEEVLSVFNRMFSTGITLGGILADLKIKFDALKLAVAEGAVIPLSNLNTALAGVDWTTLQDGVRNATTNFLTPLVTKITEIIGSESSGGVERVKKVLEDLGTLGGTFGAGLIQGFWDLAKAVSDLLGIPDPKLQDRFVYALDGKKVDETIGTESSKTGLLGIVYSLGEIVAKAGAAGLALTVLGLVMGPFGTIIAGLSTLIGGPGTLALAVVLASIILDFDDWKASIDGLMDSLDELAKAFGADSAFGSAITYIEGRIRGFGALIRITIDLISGLIDLVARAINKLKELTSTPLGGIFGFGATMTGSLNSRQSGGVIPSTGAYLMHAGETVTPRNQTTSITKPTTMYITINNNDPQAVVREIRRVWLPI